MRHYSTSCTVLHPAGQNSTYGKFRTISVNRLGVFPSAFVYGVSRTVWGTHDGRFIPAVASLNMALPGTFQY
jgi:hypothetical protein